MIFEFPISKLLNAIPTNIFKIISVCLIVLFLIPNTFAKDISFSELGIATEVSQGTSFRTPTATFYSNSTKPLEIKVTCEYKYFYYIIIHVNDEQYESPRLYKGRDILLTFNNIKKGNNTIYLSGYANKSGSHNLIIHGYSKISSPDIFLPPQVLTPTPKSNSNSNSWSSLFYALYTIFVTILIAKVMGALSGNPKKEQTYEPRVLKPTYEPRVPKPTYEPKMSYEEYIRSEQWKKLSYNFKLKANGQCFCCGRYVGLSGLESHHIRYPENFENDNENNLRALCRGCHQKRHPEKNT